MVKDGRGEGRRGEGRRVARGKRREEYTLDNRSLLVLVLVVTIMQVCELYNFEFPALVESQSLVRSCSDLCNIQEEQHGNNQVVVVHHGAWFCRSNQYSSSLNYALVSLAALYFSSVHCFMPLLSLSLCVIRL